MSAVFFGVSLRGTTLRRGLLVLGTVLLLHALAIVMVRRELAMAGPAELTQTTLSIALLRAPPAPAPSEAPPTPKPPPAPRTERTPTLPTPPLPAVPDPIPPVVHEPPPPEPVAAAPTTPLADPANSPLAGARQLPTQGRIAYTTSYSRMRGMEALTYVDWTIDVDKSRYELWLRTIDPPGLLDLKSSGELRSFGIAPDKYVERVDIANRELSVEFDWSASVVRFAGRGAGEPAAFGEGTQDPLSLQFHLPLLAQSYPWRFTPGSEITFQVARRRVESYSFTVAGFETVRVQGRDIQTLKIQKLRSPGSNRQVELWMAPEFDWIPAKLRFVDANDEVWESVLAHLPGAEPAPTPPSQTENVKP